MPSHGLFSNLSPEIFGLRSEEEVLFPSVSDTLFNYQDFLKKVDNEYIAQLDSAQRQAKVAIIGAGQAGMVAAYELLRAGIKPVIYEASCRLGGRAWSETKPWAPGAIAEMGAMRFPHTAAFTYYTNQFNLSLSDHFPDPGKVPTLLYYKNQAMTWNAGDAPPGEFNNIKSDWEHFLSQLKIDQITAALKTGQFEQARVLWQALINKYSNVTFLTAISEGIPNWGTEELAAFGALGIGSGGFGPLYQVCFLEMLRLLVNGLEYKQQLLLEGISALPRNFYQDKVETAAGELISLESIDAIRWEHKVSAIRHNACERYPITLSFAAPDIDEQGFDSVIVATTTRSMDVMGMTLSNTIAESSKVGVRKVHLMNSSKMFIFTPDKFWLKDTSLPQNIQTDEMLRGLYCLDYGEQTDKGVVLVSYTWGDDSSKLLALSPEERYDIFYQTLQIASPEFAAHLNKDQVEIMNVDWQLESNYYGAFKVDYAGQEPYVKDLYFQFQSCLAEDSGQIQDTGVYLAGDSVSWLGGWTEGALQTGLNAACAVAHHLGGKVVANSPLTQNPNAYQY